MKIFPIKVILLLNILDTLYTKYMIICYHGSTSRSILALFLTPTTVPSRDSPVDRYSGTTDFLPLLHVQIIHTQTFVVSSFASKYCLHYLNAGSATVNFVV